MPKLKDKTAIITGSTKGIGYGIAELFASEGAKIVLCGRDEKAGKKAKQGVEEQGGEAIFVRTDVSVPEENRRLLEQTKEAFGTPDIIVANAGMLGLGSITEVPVETWNQTLDTNLNALFHLLRHAIPDMQDNGGGSVVVIGSIASRKGFPNHAAYCASKGAVEALVRQVAVDTAPEIRINLIEPGPVDTELYRYSAIAFPNPDTILDEVPGTVPMGRVGAPDDIAKSALFLANDEDAGWITGSVVTVDGGASAAG
jgi:NAD(P)-dependent dehydrogenase (short-subunit alcohol dehydrogenase family)